MVNDPIFQCFITSLPSLVFLLFPPALDDCHNGLGLVYLVSTVARNSKGWLSNMEALGIFQLIKVKMKDDLWTVQEDKH